MPISLLFWFLFILWVLFGGYAYYNPPTFAWRPFGGHVLLGILLFLLGWAEFGFVISGAHR